MNLERLKNKTARSKRSPLYRPLTVTRSFSGAIIILTVLLLSNNLYSQDKTSKRYFKEIGWTILVPNDFAVLDSAQNEAIVNHGKKGLEEEFDAKVNLLKTITLISARKSKNYFSASLTPPDPQKKQTPAEVISFQEQTIYRAMSQNAKVDSSSTKIVMDGLPFRKFDMTIHLNEKASFGMTLVSRLYKEYYFVVAYVYLDKVTKEQIETMLTTSKFSK